MCIYTLGKLSSFFNRLKLFLSLNMINKIQENILSLRVSQSAIFFEIIYLSACCESFEFPLEIVSRHHHLSSTCFLPFPKTVTRYDFETSITPGGKTAERSQSLFRLIAILFAAVDSMHSRQSKKFRPGNRAVFRPTRTPTKGNASSPIPAEPGQFILPAR